MRYLYLLFSLLSQVVMAQHTSVKMQHKRLATKQVAQHKQLLSKQSAQHKRVAINPATKIKPVKHLAKTKSIKQLAQQSKRKNYMRGIASFYGGDKFEGRQMANGDYFDSSQFSAAHSSLPLGTKLKITNLANKRTVYLEVTDRMPKKRQRTIDVSYAVAKSLGMVQQGLAHVILQKVTNSEYNKNSLVLAHNVSQKTEDQS